MACNKKQLKLCGNKECKICFDRSFASYDGKTQNGKLKVDCWDYEKNDNVKPWELRKCHIGKYYFKCDVCNHIFNISISKITFNTQWCKFCGKKDLCEKDCKYCYFNSFASYTDRTIKGKLKVNCWDKNKNKRITPRNILKGTHNKYWFKCDVCNHLFDICIKEVSLRNSWCKFCANRELCDCHSCKFCYAGSFASYLGKTVKGMLKVECWDVVENNYIIPRNVPLCRNKKYWFKCDVCSHLFDISLDSVAGGCWCRFCAGKELCKSDICDYCFENSFISYKGKTCKGKLKVKCWNINKNKHITPRDIAIKATSKYWFICDVCNHSFNKSINHITGMSSWCPFCINKTEGKFKHWFHKHYPNNQLKHQYIADWCKNPDTKRHLPFDFVIEDLKLIIEIDGEQHFNKISNWQSPDTTFEFDKYKMRVAMENGHSIIRILQEDIWGNKNDWKKKFKENCVLQDSPTIICIGCDIKYKKYTEIKMENTQTTDKPVKCEKCNKTYKLYANYKKHLETELHKTGKKKVRSDKKPDYKCDICNLYTTGKPSNLKLHILNNHKSQKEREKEFKFYCKLCDNGYMNDKLYNKHLTTKKHKRKCNLSKDTN